MHKVLVNLIVKLAQKNLVWLGELTVNMTISVDWDVKPQTKQKQNEYKIMV